MLAALALSQSLPEDTVDERVFLAKLPLVKHFQHLIRSYIAPGTLETPDGRLCHQYGFVTAQFARVYLNEPYLREAGAMLIATIQCEKMMQGASWPRDRCSLPLLKGLAVTFWKLGRLEDAAEALEFQYKSSTEFVGEMEDLTAWAAGRLRDVRERKVAFFDYGRHAIVASTTSKQPPQSLQESHDDDSQIMSDCIAGETSDQEWNLVQLVE